MGIERIPCYFIMDVEYPTVYDFMRWNKELYMKGFDDSFMIRIMVLTPEQMHSFFQSLANTFLAIFNLTERSEFAGFRIMTLRGEIY